MDLTISLTVVGVVIAAVALGIQIKQSRQDKVEKLKSRRGLVTKLDNLRASVQASLDEAEKFWVVDPAIPSAAVSTAMGQRVHDFEANKLDDKDFNELCAIEVGSQAKYSDIPKLVTWFFNMGRIGSLYIYRSKPEAYQPLKLEMTTLIALLEGAIRRLQEPD